MTTLRLFSTVLTIFISTASAFQQTTILQVQTQTATSPASRLGLGNKISHNHSNKGNSIFLLHKISCFHRRRESSLLLGNLSDEDLKQPASANSHAKFLQNPITLSLIAFCYWYLLVFGAAAASNGLPVPSFLPMVPGWPPSDQDLIPVIEDSIHFFYISDIINIFSKDTSFIEQLPQLRLAFFNIAEAWIFSFLPILLEDKKRLPLPVVLITWFGALGLTNAFLAPYLALRQLLNNDTVKDEKNDRSINSKILNNSIGIVASSVVAYASFQTIITTVNAPNEWIDFLNLIKNDRTYLAFAIDLVLFTLFQSFLLDELKVQNVKSNDDDVHTKVNIPFIGIMSWLFKQ